MDDLLDPLSCSKGLKYQDVFHIKLALPEWCCITQEKENKLMSETNGISLFHFNEYEQQ
ncbi:hypothetical protein [Brevibacillus porteri]|uniref:hypothetical protein n=1 Tax=Brevibacillus porteri TaxID=2126350 RepID=UPI003D1D097A